MGGTYDAVVIGAGHNGLVSAIRLAEAGWSVCVLERAERAGGAVRSGELTLPGVEHDTYSTNHNLFLASPFYADHKDALERHGLRYAVSDRPFANAFPGGAALRVVQDTERTLEGLRAHDERDAEGWARLDALFERLAPMLFGLYAAPVPSLHDPRAGLTVARLLGSGRRDLGALSRILLSSTRDLVEEHLHTPEAQALLACWGLHLDFGPDVSGGALFPFLECFSDQRAGMAVVEGGAQRMVDALEAVLADAGGELRTRAEVVRVEVAGGRATGVVLADGERIGARRAVVACTTPGALAGRLLDGAPSQPQAAAQAAGFRHGPGTMMVHLALDGPVPWAAGGDLDEYAYVHVAPYLGDLARTYAASVDGRLPAEPLLVVGQTTAVDPTRAPAGTHIAWVQVRTLPAVPAGDEAGELGGGSWDELGPAYAERVLDKLERYAPGVRARIRGQAVLTPADLERANPNLVGGDSLAGSMHLRQTFALRPHPAWAGHRTPVDALWLTGASTWPGGGLNALSGDHAAAAVLAEAGGARRVLARARRAGGRGLFARAAG